MTSYPLEYIALGQELMKICDATRSRNALVFDHVGITWWSAKEFAGAERDTVCDLVDGVAKSMGQRLKRGRRLERSIQSGTYSLYCKSFAAIYVVGVFFVGSPPEFLVRRVVKASLPRIEALTVSLPPPSGPECNTGVAAKRIK